MGDMKTWKKIDRNLKVSIISSFIFGIIAHGYCCFNGFFNNDSLNLLFTDIKYHGIGIGRVLRPLFGTIAGPYTLPFLSVFFSLILIALAVWYISKIFNLKNKTSIVILSAVLTTNFTLTLINASCIQDSACYMLAMFLSVYAVYLIRKYNKWFIYVIAIVLFGASLALYQPMIQCAIILLLICLFFDIFKNKSDKKNIICGPIYLGLIIAALFAYSLMVVSEVSKTEISLVNTYNGITQVGQFDSISSILDAITTTYTNVYYFFIDKIIQCGYFHEIVIGILNIVVLALIIVCCIVKIVIEKPGVLKTLLLACVVLLMPFGINFVCFISQGTEHEIMVYSFSFIYVFAVALVESINKDSIINLGKKTQINSFEIFKVFNIAMTSIALLLVFNFSIFSNQCYLCKQLQVNSTNQIMNRIVYELEHTPGYVAGETPVAIIGDLGYNKSLMTDSEFDTDWYGMRGKSSISFYSCYKHYFKYYLNYPINMVEPETAKELSQTEAFEHMFVYGSPHQYPANNHILDIDGTLVVKLSWNWSDEFFV